MSQTQTNSARPTHVALVAVLPQKQAPRVWLARTQGGFELPHSGVHAGESPEDTAQELLRQVGLRVNAAPLLVRDVDLQTGRTRLFFFDGSRQPENVPGEGPVYWWRKAGLEEAFYVLDEAYEPVVALVDKIGRRSTLAHAA